MLENRSKLGEAQSLQQFSRDVDEMEIWITERLHTALDESYRDPANIQVIGLTQGSVLCCSFTILANFFLNLIVIRGIFHP